MAENKNGNKKDIVEQLKQLAEVYLVGGYVRDSLLFPEHREKLSDKDWLVVGSSKQQMTELGFIQVGKDFPVFIHPYTNEQYALARAEIKTAKGYHGFEFATDNIGLLDDLKRRDISINAMAMDEAGKIIDPFKGKKDLDKKIIRHTSSQFSEDPLRVIRVARFLAKFHHLGFEVDPKTKKLLIEMVKSGQINELTPERVWLEVEKLCQYQSPQVFFDLLAEIGALEVLFLGYAQELEGTKSNWFKKLNRAINLKELSLELKVALLFFGYPHKNKLIKTYKLSKKLSKLLLLLHHYQNTFNQLLEDKMDSDLKEVASGLNSLFKQSRAIEQDSLINEFIILQMLIFDIPLNCKPLLRFVKALHCYSFYDVAQKIKELKKNPKTKNVISELIDEHRTAKIEQALRQLN